MKHALQLIEKNLKDKSEYLDLGNCGLKNELPAELFKCIWIKELNLGTNFRKPSNLIRPDNIICRNPEIWNIFEGDELVILKNLPNLESIHFSNNKITSFAFLEQLPQLIELSICRNIILDLDCLWNLSKLKNLTVERCQLSNISNLETKNDLHFLYLEDNNISNFSPLKNLLKLNYLHFDSNKLTNLNFLTDLKELKKLSIFDSTGELNFLKNLVNLEELYVNSPKSLNTAKISDLINLKKLSLNNNQIKSIDFLKNLKNLEFLSLEGNKITDLSHLVPFLRNGMRIIQPKSFENTGINISNNPILHPPKEIFNEGEEAIIRYFDNINKQGTDYIFEAKVTLVGDGNSGKTSLLRRLIDRTSQLPKSFQRTRGIEVSDWEFLDLTGQNYIAHIWDFGGQDVYYPVHRFFITENSVFVLMASTRNARNNHNFNYWIPTIFQFGGFSPIILVQNCFDGNSSPWNDLEVFWSNSVFNLSKPYYEIDLVNDNKGLNQLESVIQNNIINLPHISKPVPKSWTNVRNRLLRVVKSKDFILFTEFIDLCRKVDKENFENIVDCEDLGNFLHRLGIIIWYSKNPILKNIVILKPEWAMSALYIILDDIEIQNNNGIINQKDFERLWSEPTYSDNHYQLKQMLEVFKIAFPKKHVKSTYILPARLPSIPENLIWKFSPKYVYIIYKFTFMPRGIINQLSAELSRYIKSENEVWNDAVVFELNASTCLIREILNEREISLQGSGKNVQNLMVLIMNSFSDILDDYKELSPKILVPCKCVQCRK